MNTEKEIVWNSVRAKGRLEMNHKMEVNRSTLMPFFLLFL